MPMRHCFVCPKTFSSVHHCPVSSINVQLSVIVLSIRQMSVYCFSYVIFVHHCSYVMSDRLPLFTTCPFDHMSVRPHVRSTSRPSDLMFVRPMKLEPHTAAICNCRLPDNEKSSLRLRLRLFYPTLTRCRNQNLCHGSNIVVLIKLKLQLPNGRRLLPYQSQTLCS